MKMTKAYKIPEYLTPETHHWPCHKQRTFGPINIHSAVLQHSANAISQIIFKV